jgi:hypothetical protein
MMGEIVDPWAEVMGDIMGKVEHMHLSDDDVIYGNLFPYLQSYMYMN